MQQKCDIPASKYKILTESHCAKDSLEGKGEGVPALAITLNIPKLRSSTLFTKLGSSEGPMVFFVISQPFDAVDYSNYVFWVSETIIQ